jgi:surfactin synthase thioesterase subunit
MARLRFLCFPYAGSGPSAYLGWARRLPPLVELRLVAPPGCELRETEPLETSLTHYVESVVEALLAEPSFPLALFGHSLGAMIAYEVALRLVAAGRPPVHLFVSAKESPLDPLPLEVLHLLDDQRLMARTRELFGGLPDELVDHPELMASVLHRLRGDLSLLSQVESKPRPRLRIPVTVLWSPDDRSMTGEQANAWQDLVEGPISVASFPGGHFFVHERTPEVLRFVSGQLGYGDHDAG